MIEDQLDMDYSDFLKGRVISESEDMSIGHIEKKLIKEIFKKNYKISSRFKEIKSLKLLDRNFYYDVFTFSCENETYCLKFGEDDDHYLFKREFDVLKKIEKYKVSPTPILIVRDKNYSCLITSFEFSQSVKNEGLSCITKNLQSFAESLKTIHNNSKSDFSERDMFLDMCFSMASFDEVLDSEDLDELKNIDQFNNCQQILKSLKDCILLQIESMPEVDACICHTNLKPSNILFRNNTFKFCNFQESFVLSPMWDLAMICIKTELHRFPILESKFVKHYNAEKEKEIKDALPAYKDVCFKIMLHEIICTYFYRLIIVNNEGMVGLFNSYQNIRPLVFKEFPIYVETLDKMFGDFNKII